jgi:hypothetical protein
VEDRPKYKYIHITHSYNIFPIVGLLEETTGGGKEEEKDRDQTILKYTASV